MFYIWSSSLIPLLTRMSFYNDGIQSSLVFFLVDDFGTFSTPVSFSLGPWWFPPGPSPLRPLIYGRRNRRDEGLGSDHGLQINRLVSSLPFPQTDSRPTSPHLLLLLFTVYKWYQRSVVTRPTCKHVSLRVLEHPSVGPDERATTLYCSWRTSHPVTSGPYSVSKGPGPLHLSVCRKDYRRTRTSTPSLRLWHLPITFHSRTRHTRSPPLSPGTVPPTDHQDLVRPRPDPNFKPRNPKPTRRRGEVLT